MDTTINVFRLFLCAGIVLALLGMPTNARAQCYACGFSNTGSTCDDATDGSEGCIQSFDESGNTDCGTFGGFCTVRPPIRTAGANFPAKTLQHFPALLVSATSTLEGQGDSLTGSQFVIENRGRACRRNVVWTLLPRQLEDWIDRDPGTGTRRT